MMPEQEKIKTQKPKKNYLLDDESDNLKREPIIENEDYKPAGKLVGKTAIITGGDSGIGAATAILFAKEGAKVAFTYYSSDDDAERTENRLQELSADVLVFKGDVGDENFSETVVEEVVSKWGSIDVLVNHAGEQHFQKSITKISAEQIDRTYRTNIFSMFYFVKAAFPHMMKMEVSLILLLLQHIKEIQILWTILVQMELLFHLLAHYLRIRNL